MSPPFIPDSISTLIQVEPSLPTSHPHVTLGHPLLLLLLLFCLRALKSPMTFAKLRIIIPLNYLPRRRPRATEEEEGTPPVPPSFVHPKDPSGGEAV